MFPYRWPGELQVARLIGFTGPQWKEGLGDSRDPGERPLAVFECLGLTFPWSSLTPVPVLYQTF